VELRQVITEEPAMTMMATLVHVIEHRLPDRGRCPKLWRTSQKSQVSERPETLFVKRVLRHWLVASRSSGWRTARNVSPGPFSRHHRAQRWRTSDATNPYPQSPTLTRPNTPQNMKLDRVCSRAAMADSRYGTTNESPTCTCQTLARPS
jgi:hypothetical protein